MDFEGIAKRIVEKIADANVGMDFTCPADEEEAQGIVSAELRAAVGASVGTEDKTTALREYANGHPYRDKWIETNNSLYLKFSVAADFVRGQSLDAVRANFGAEVPAAGCAACDGTGSWPDGRICPSCQGRGGFGRAFAVRANVGAGGTSPEKPADTSST